MRFAFLGVWALITVDPVLHAAEIDTTPMPVVAAPAFTELKWADWSPIDDRGRPQDLRLILITSANDKTKRNFALTQRGVIHVFPNDQNATKSEVFLDVESLVAYDDKTNEEGALGLTFHPKYAENGQFFFYYTNKARPHQNVLSRFRVDPKNPGKALPQSEEILLVFDKPYWNHDGGTIVFGPDGYLYVALGDGGLANDPHENGQNLGTLLGKVLRIDVDRRDGDLKYAIPQDNPFVGREGARGEIWAYGLRNVWRMAFDPKTNVLWAGDVGQDLWEEIDLIEKGGNYGWNVREGMHPFGRKGSPPRSDLIDPIFEYHHTIGKSITGGSVYRGKQVPELEGSYLYADYVSGRIWALFYDEKAKRVVANREIRGPGFPVISFGEDADGEVYFTTYSPVSRPLYRFTPTDKAKRRSK